MTAALLLSTLLLTGGAPETPASLAHDYYPLRIGTSWTYVSTLRGEFTNSVVDTARVDNVLWYRIASTDERGATQHMLTRQDGERIIQRLPNGSEMLLVDFAVPVDEAFVAQQGAAVAYIAHHDTLTVLGARYRDVRHYRYTGAGLQYDVYYARGIGQVAVEYVREVMRSRLVRATIDGVEHVFDGPSSPAITTGALQPAQVQNLALLAEVWGFLKYHHPAVTGGDVDWDAALLDVMPHIIEARDGATAVTHLNRWVAQLGDAPPCAPCAALGDDVHLIPDNDWLHDRERLGPELSARLVAVHSNRSTAAAQRYVSFAPGVGNPLFTGEASYLGSGVPDAGHRLLALFRYWNVIRYWFPYRDLIDDDWDDVLREFIPVLLHADDNAAYRIAMLRLAARIDDTHASVHAANEVRPPQGTAQLPVTLRYVEDRAVVKGYSHAELGPASGLEVGDVVLRIDGAEVDSLIAAWAPYYPASNEPARLHAIALALTRGAPGTVRVTVMRDGAHREVTAERVPITSLDRRAGTMHDLPGGEAFRMLDDDVAYLKLSAVRVDDVPQYFERAADAAVFAIDIRNYPAQFVVYAIGGRLVDEPTPFALFTAGDAANPGAFRWTGPATLQPVAPRYTGTVVVLVDETSISQSEFTAMALRAAPGAIVVGSTTAAADGNVSVIPLPGGPTTNITGIGVFYPDRRPTQRIGILPDLEVRPTIAGIRAGRDEVLEAGVSRALGREWRLPAQ
jgi:C-terminal processing protease CtpA/Prc